MLLASTEPGSPAPGSMPHVQGLVYGSVCSGIEAATAAWEPLGWRPAFFAEIEPFPSAVLAHRHPAIPNLGDMTAIDGSAWRGRIDVLVGGTPCQAFSVAGLRKSLDDARGNLALRFVDLAHAIEPAWIVWENVPGVLSTRDNAFGCLLGGLAGEDGPVVPPGGKWSDAGVVFGPARTVAWRVFMPNITAWPNDAVVCSLLQVLETGPIPSKYFLSAKACAGIIRRAEKRNKALPEPLRAALAAVAGSASTICPSPSAATTPPVPSTSPPR